METNEPQAPTSTTQAAPAQQAPPQTATPPASTPLAAAPVPAVPVPAVPVPAGPGMSRRRVLGGVVVAGAAAPVLAACGGGGETSTGDDPTEEPTPEEETPSAEDTPAEEESPAGEDGPGGAALAKTSEIPVGGGMAFVEQKVVVTQPEQGTFKAFTGVCTHKGCTIDKVESGKIACPCHGSTFDIATGKPVTGPNGMPASAITALKAMEVAVDGDEIRMKA